MKCGMGWDDLCWYMCVCMCTCTCVYMMCVCVCLDDHAHQILF